MRKHSYKNKVLHKNKTKIHKNYKYKKKIVTVIQYTKHISETYATEIHTHTSFIHPYTEP